MNENLRALEHFAEALRVVLANPVSKGTLARLKREKKDAKNL